MENRNELIDKLSQTLYIFVNQIKLKLTLGEEIR